MRKSLFIISAAISLIPASVSAQDFKSATVDSLVHFSDLNYIHNIEDGALNPVGLSYVPLPELAKIDVGYRWGKGEFHNVDASGHTDGLHVSAFGIKRLNKIVFDGGVDYFNENKRLAMWNSTLYQSPLNPFILADSVRSDYNTERFRVRGRIAYIASPKIRFGVNVDYNVGVMSDEQDPRLETKGMRFIINPGIQWQITPVVAVGATAGLNLFNESYSYSCLATAVNYKFYLMNGLGSFYPQSGSSYSRTAKGTSWFAGGNVRLDISDSVKNYIAATYHRHDENATDGGTSYQFKAGKYTNDAVKVNERFSIVKDGMAHNITLDYEGNKVNGRWYEQKPVVENGTTRYEVMGSAIKSKRIFIAANAAYRFDLLDNSGITTFKAGASLGYAKSHEKNFPELYFRKYDRLTAGINATKYLHIKNVRLGIGIDGSYSSCLSSSFNFAGEAIADDYSLPMTAYLTSSFYTINGNISADIPVRSVIIGVNCGGGTEQCTGGKSHAFKSKSFNTFHAALSLYF